MRVVCLLLPLLMSCDEKIDVENAPPSAQALRWCEAAGRSYFQIELRDLEGDPVDLDLLLELEDQAPIRAGSGSSGDGLEGLSSDKQPILHRVEWCQAEEFCSCLAEPLSQIKGCASWEPDGPRSLKLRILAQDHEGEEFSSEQVELELEPCEG